MQARAASVAAAISAFLNMLHLSAVPSLAATTRGKMTSCSQTVNDEKKVGSSCTGLKFPGHETERYTMSFSTPDALTPALWTSERAASAPSGCGVTVVDSPKDAGVKMMEGGDTDRTFCPSCLLNGAFLPQVLKQPTYATATVTWSAALNAKIEVGGWIDAYDNTRICTLTPVFDGEVIPDLSCAC